MPMLDSYLFFDGDCAQALDFYQGILGGRIEAMMKYSDSPDPQQCPPGSGDRIMHGCLVLDGGRLLMASDTPSGQFDGAPRSFSLALNYQTADEARAVFDRLAAGGSVVMPMSKTFWTDAFGMCKDRFGVQWMVGGGAQPRRD